jgi:septal ring factor EnvC (AmiA/AmiB activator)
VEKLNEQTKNYLCIAGYVLCIIIVIAIGWAMLHDNGGSTDKLRDQIDTAREQQQQTQRTLESISTGIRDSQRTVDDIDRSNSESQRTTENISRANDAIKESIDGASEQNTECRAIVSDSQQRISESKSILESVRKTAETNEGTNKNP